MAAKPTVLILKHMLGVRSQGNCTASWHIKVGFAISSDGIGLASIWIGGGAPAGFGFGSSDLDAGVAWIEARGAPGAPQLILYREGGWALYSRCAVNSQSGY